jgi:hypothetical protein
MHREERKSTHRKHLQGRGTVARGNSEEILRSSKGGGSKRKTPAIIVHGNTLTLETWSNWYTPAHIIGGWDWKLRRKEMQPVVEPEPIQQIPYPAILPKEVGSQLTLF